MGMQGGNTNNAQTPSPAAPQQVNPWAKLLKGGLSGLGTGLQSYNQQQQTMQNPNQNRMFYGA